MDYQFPSLAGQGAIAFDVETYDPELKTRGPGAHRDGFIAGVAVGTERGFRQYYPVAHEEGPNLPKDQVFAYLRKELQTPVPKIGANLIYDLGFLAEVDVFPTGPFYDVQVAEPLLDESAFSYSLEALAQKYLSVGKTDEELDKFLKEKFGRKSNVKTDIWRAPPRIVGPYASGDVDLPIRIFALQQAELHKQDLWDLFVMESKLIPMLLAMRRRGVRVNIERTQEMYDRLTADQDRITQEIRRISGVELSPWDTASLAKVFDGLGLSYPMTPKTQKPSFTGSFLDEHPHPITDLVRQTRKLDKLRGTFLMGSILEGHTRGRIHCQFNQLKSDDGGAVSGRFSSSKPNLQFIPVRTAEGKLIRSMFEPDEGQDWYKFDYSQIEYRLVVHDAAQLKLRGAQEVADIYCNDPDADFHQSIAEMTGLERGPAKTVNFGILYGEGLPKLCAQLGLTMEQGQALMREYHRRAPFVKLLSDGAKAQANVTGIITTLLGRKRRFDVWCVRRSGKDTFINHRVPGATRAFTHKSLNARVQGSAADVMKKSMVDVWESGVCDVLGVPQLTVHDELDGSVPRTAQGAEALREMQHIMENTVQLLVPLKVDGGTGPNWGAIK